MLASPDTSPKRKRGKPLQMTRGLRGPAPKGAASKSVSEDNQCGVPERPRRRFGLRKGRGHPSWRRALFSAGVLELDFGVGELLLELVDARLGDGGAGDVEIFEGREGFEMDQPRVGDLRQAEVEKLEGG